MEKTYDVGALKRAFDTALSLQVGPATGNKPITGAIPFVQLKKPEEPRL